MLPRIDPTRSEPIYIQLMDEIKYFVATGMMGPGDPLLSVREMAMKLRVNPNTVARAYRELEHEGVVVTFRGKGVYISEASRGIDKRRALVEMKKSLDKLLVNAFHWGISPDQIKELLDKQVEKFKNMRVK